MAHDNYVTILSQLSFDMLLYVTCRVGHDITLPWKKQSVQNKTKNVTFILNVSRNKVQVRYLKW